MTNQYDTPLFAFRHTRPFKDIIGTVCQFCNASLAFTSYPAILIAIEEHHTCPQMQRFFENSKPTDQFFRQPVLRQNRAGEVARVHMNKVGATKGRGGGVAE
jgi:hypothetical protein